MTAPRPEAVELARAIVRAVTFDEYDEDVWNATDLIDAALTAARADERERAARVCEAEEAQQFELAMQRTVQQLGSSPHDYAAECLHDCAAAIRAMGDYALRHEEEGR